METETVRARQRTFKDIPVFSPQYATTPVSLSRNPFFSTVALSGTGTTHLKRFTRHIRLYKDKIYCANIQRELKFGTHKREDDIDAHT